MKNWGDDRKRVLCVFPNDPIAAYYTKGEIKESYFNPCNLFDEIHIISPGAVDIEPSKVQVLAGKASLYIHPIGRARQFFFRRREILDFLRKVKPEVIRGYNPLITGYYAVYFGKKLGVPSVISLHSDYDNELYFRRRYEPVWNYGKYYAVSKVTERYVMRNATKVICVTHHLTRYAHRLGAKDVAVIYNRVDTARFKPPDGKKRNPKLLILSIGRLDPQKYQKCLIRAVRDLDVDLLLVGRGELEGYLKRLVRELDAQLKVQFIPSVPHSQIHQYYQQADVFAIATHYEGFCIPVLEAMACGLPTVASDIPPIREIVGNKGILVKNTPNAFKEAFIELMESPRLRKELGAKARRRAETLDGRIMEEKEASVYLEVAKKTSA